MNVQDIDTPVDRPQASPEAPSRWWPVQGHRARSTLLVCAVMLALLAVWALVAAVVLLPARGDVLAGRERLQAGRDAVMGGQFQAATGEFADAEGAFRRAERRFANPAVRAVRLLPVFGGPLERVADATTAARLVSGAGQEVVGAVGALPNGPEALLPRDGTIPVEPLRTLAPGMERARALVEEAGEVVDGSPDAWLPEGLATQYDTLVAELAGLRRTMAVAEVLTRQLPTFLGAEQPRHYFLGAQNPAELRGTGGFIGAFAVVGVENGTLRFDDFAPIQDLRNLPAAAVTPPDPSYAARYDRYGGAGFWMNINMTPDFPTAARAIETLYGQVTGTALDGVVVVDPTVLAALLELSGPLEHSQFGRLDADSVVPFVANQAYDRFEEGDERKRVLGGIATGILHRFLEGGVDPDLGRLSDKLSDLGAGGHLLVHAVDPEVQTALELAGVAGGLRSDDGDFLAVVGNNAAGNKVDYYVDRSVRHRVELEDDGSASTLTEVRLANASPTQGQPKHIIGPWSRDYVAGENVTIVSTYCRAGCQLVEFSHDGVPRALRTEQELGLPVFTTTSRVRSGEEDLLSYRLVVPQAWTNEGDERVYRFAYHGQPTIRPTTVTLDVGVPAGHELVAANPSAQVRDGRVLWEGQPGRTASVELRFAPRPEPALVRAWNAWRALLGRPVLRIPLG